jgi:sugar phosphate isomerase/epimerase
MVEPRLRLRYAYNTNGLLAHRLEHVLDLLATEGYDGVAITLDHSHLDPLARDAETTAQRVADALRVRGLGAVVETGARYLLDPFRKHWPALTSAAPELRARRLRFLRRAITLGGLLNAEAVCFFSGAVDADASRYDAKGWLAEAVDALLDTAREVGVRLAIEQEPGMLIDNVSDALELLDTHTDLLCALDVGHCLVTGEMEPAAAVEVLRHRLGPVTVEDMRRGTHEHLPFGDGDIDLTSVLRSLTRIEHQGLVTVELSRDSHRGAELVRRSIHALRAAEAAA